MWMFKSQPSVFSYHWDIGCCKHRIPTHYTEPSSLSAQKMLPHLLQHWSQCELPRNTTKAAFLLSDNKIHFQFRNTFGSESNHAIKTHPGAFPCTDLSRKLLVLSPTPFQHRWEQQHHGYPRHQTATGKCLNMGTWFEWCCLNNLYQKMTACSSQSQISHIWETIASISSCCTHRSQQPLQGSKTPRKDRHSELGLCSFCQCNGLVKISTWVCLYQYQSYSKLGTAVPA